MQSADTNNNQSKDGLLKLTFPNNVNLYIYQNDISSVFLDGVVNAANGHLCHSGNYR